MTFVFPSAPSTADIVDVAICGNTAMHHLLLGLPVRQLGRAPFVAAVRDAMDVKARDLDLTACPGAYVHMAPNIGGFVGSDHVTALHRHASALAGQATTLVMDIGTNTEISLIHRGDILSASCPSGPALEGGHISCGMRAAEGAIERVTVADGRIKIGVIGNRQPVGLCGSGVIDAMAALRQAGILNDGGRIAGAHADIAEVDGKRVAVLAPGVTFTQHDVRAVQLAKAAIRTGIELLLRDRGLAEDDIERVVIAGAFGAYIDVASAIAIGLLPALPLDRFSQVGNAAGVGVRQLLASRKTRAQARELAQRCRYVELSTRGDFQKSFLHNIGFKQQESVVTSLPGFGIAMIGDRINPGFKSTKLLLDNEDMAGVQALAVKQVDAGASALDVTIGPRGATDFDILGEGRARHPGRGNGGAVLRFAEHASAGICLKTYDRARAGGQPALINSITEQRWDLMNLYKDFGPFKVIVMASERMENGAAKQTRPPTKSPPPPGAPHCACKTITAWRWTISTSISRSALWSPTPTDCIARPWIQFARCTTIRSCRACISWAGSPISASSCHQKPPTALISSFRLNAPF